MSTQLKNIGLHFPPIQVIGYPNQFARHFRRAAATSGNMDSIPASVPKTVAPFLARAKELAARDPVMAYWCKLS